MVKVNFDQKKPIDEINSRDDPIQDFLRRAVSLSERNQSREKLLNTLLRINEDIMSGTPEDQACKKEGVDYLWYKRLWERVIKIEIRGSSTYSNWRNNFLCDLCSLSRKDNPENFIPYDDFDEVFDIVLDRLPERHKRAIILYYRDGLTLEEVGNELNVKRERVRQIISKGMRILRHPQNYNLIAYGFKKCEVLNKLDDEFIDLKKRKERRNFQLKMKGYFDKNKDEIDKETFGKVKDCDLKLLDLSTRPFNCLIRSGHRTIDDVLAIKDITKLMKIRNLGVKGIKEIIEKMEIAGFTEWAAQIRESGYID